MNILMISAEAYCATVSLGQRCVCQHVARADECWVLQRPTCCWPISVEASFTFTTLQQPSLTFELLTSCLCVCIVCVCVLMWTHQGAFFLKLLL